MESYQFWVNFREKVENEKILSLFERAGADFLEDYESFWNSIPDVKSLFFEIRSPRGLTQIHVLLDKKKGFVDEFSVRFSVASPAAVIDQTFEFFARLDAAAPIVLRDWEIVDHLWRRDVKAGKRSNSFAVMKPDREADAGYETAAVIPIDAGLFKANEPGVAKRKIVLENETGAIVGGDETFRYWEENPSNVEAKLVDIIKTEL